MLQFFINVLKAWISSMSHWSFWISLFLILLIILFFLLLRKSLFFLLYLFDKILFSRKLKKWAKKNGYSYEKRKEIKNSKLNEQSHEFIRLSLNDNNYNIKFFPYVQKNKILTILNDNLCEVSSRFVLLGSFNRFYGKIPGASNGNPIVSGTLTTRKKKLNVTFDNITESKNQNIMIIPKNACNVSFIEGNSIILADSGTLYRDQFVFYHSNRVINYLDRNKINI